MKTGCQYGGGDAQGELGRGNEFRSVRPKAAFPIDARFGGYAADQYSSASITVRTRVVTEGSAGSGDISSMSRS